MRIPHQVLVDGQDLPEMFKHLGQVVQESLEAIAKEHKIDPAKKLTVRVDIVRSVVFDEVGVGWWVFNATWDIHTTEKICEQCGVQISKDVDICATCAGDS